MYADSFTLNSRGDSVQKLSLVEDELNEIFKKAEKNVKLKKRDKNTPLTLRKHVLIFYRIIINYT